MSNCQLGFSPDRQSIQFFYAINIICLLLVANVSWGQVIREARFPEGQITSDYSGDEFMLSYVGNLNFTPMMGRLNDEPESLSSGSARLHSFQSKGWVPMGIMKNPISKKCMARRLDQRLNGNMLTSDFAAELNEYFSECGNELVYQHDKGLSGLYDFLTVSYPIYDLPNLKRVQFVFEDDTLLDGVVAVQDQRPRPWVILKCGVFCAAGDGFTTRNFLMYLFDQGPFNIIFLGNRTAIDYIQNNRSLTAGGYHESHDFFEVARWLKEKSIWANPQLEIHGLGVSLGGSAALYAAEFDNEYRNQTQNKQNLFFNSISTVCPVVDLHTTVQNMLSSPIKGTLIGHFAWDKIKNTLPHLDLAQGILSPDHRPSNSELIQKLGIIAAKYGEVWGKSPFYKRNLPPISRLEDEWNFNNFVRLSDHRNMTPTLILSSADDGIVATNLNSDKLRDLPEVQNNQNIGVVTVNYGDHCALSTSYGYPTVAAILRNFIIQNSPHYQKEMNTVGPEFSFQNINFEFNFNFAGSTLLRQWWRVLPDSQEAELILEYFDKHKRRACAFSDPHDENTMELCRTYLMAKIPLNDLSERTGVPANVTSVGEAHHWTRKLNYLVRATRDGQEIEWTSLVPNQLEFRRN